MKKLPINKGWLIAGIILLFLIVTNPSIKRFKEFEGRTSYGGLRRTANYIVFSIYEDSHSDKKYLGIIMNFFDINNFQTSRSYDETGLDSTTVEEDAKPEFNVDSLPDLPKGLILDKKNETDTVNDIPPFLKEK